MRNVLKIGLFDAATLFGRLFSIVLGAAFAFASMTGASATIVTYNSAAAWTAAVSSPSTVDFNGFTGTDAVFEGTSYTEGGALLSFWGLWALELIVSQHLAPAKIDANKHERDNSTCSADCQNEHHSAHPHPSPRLVCRQGNGFFEVRDVLFRTLVVWAGLIFPDCGHSENLSKHIGGEGRMRKPESSASEFQTEALPLDGVGGGSRRPVPSAGKERTSRRDRYERTSK
jgi:hypothetical protein